MRTTEGHLSAIHIDLDLLANQSAERSQPQLPPRALLSRGVLRGVRHRHAQLLLGFLHHLRVLPRQLAGRQKSCAPADIYCCKATCQQGYSHQCLPQLAHAVCMHSRAHANKQASYSGSSSFSAAVLPPLSIASYCTSSTLKTEGSTLACRHS